MRTACRRFSTLVVSTLLLAAVCPPSTRAADVVSAPALKAAFLFNFARFTDWPANSPPGRLTLCVLGDPAVADALDRLVGDRQISGRDVSVARLVSQRSVKSCHLLYLAGSDATSQVRALEELARSPVLTIGDGEQFVRSGGGVGLFLDEGRMRFAINTDAVLRAGLRLSSQLLGLAKVLRDEHVQS